MAGESDYQGAAPRFKGAVHTVPRIHHTWTRGKGWTSIAYHTGKIDVLKGKLNSLVGYCSQIDIEEGGGPFPTMEARWNGFAEGQVQDIDTEPVWGLAPQEVPIDLLLHPTIKAIEAAHPGTVNAIQAGVIEFKKATVASIGNFATYLPQALNNWINQAAPTNAQRTAVVKWWKKLISGEDHYRYYQPVLTRTIVVSEVYSNYGAANIDPPIYASTSILISALGVPATIASALREAMWLEVPPSVNPASAAGRYQIQQVWEPYDEVDADIYTNIVAP